MAQRSPSPYEEHHRRAGPEAPRRLGVTFRDSSTLGVFIRAYRLAAEKGTSFKLVNVTGNCSSLLEITGLDHLLVDVADVESV